MAQLKSTNITGSLSVTGNVLASKIIQLGGTKDYVLLANGDVKALSEFGIGSGGNLDLTGYVQGSGTVNAIPYFSATNTIASSIMIQSDGKINIIGATGTSDNEFPLELRSAYAGQSGIKFTDKNNTRLGYLFFNGRNPSVYQDNGTWAGPYKLWHEGNDGASSGLDADKLDGQEGTHYLDYNNFTNKPTIPTKTSELTNDSDFATQEWVTDQLGSGGSYDLSNYVDKTTEQTISGAKTFSGSNIFTNESKFTHATYAPTWVDIASGIGKSSCFTRGAFMQLITGQILLPNAACNNTSAGVTGGYETTANTLKFQTMAASGTAGQPAVTTVATIDSSGIATKALTLTSADGIAYSDGTNKINMIKFITGNSSGHGIIIGGNGSVVIGAGESAQNIPTALGIAGNTEYLYLSADEDVEFFSDCNGNSGGDRKQSIYRQSGDWDLYGKVIAQGLTIADGTDLANRTKRATWQYNSSTDCVELVW